VLAGWKQQVGPETMTDRSCGSQAHFPHQVMLKADEKVMVCRVGIVCTSKYRARCCSEYHL
jgi:hypothetical protein